MQVVTRVHGGAAAMRSRSDSNMNRLRRSDECLRTSQHTDVPLLGSGSGGMRGRNGRVCRVQTMPSQNTLRRELRTGVRKPVTYYNPIYSNLVQLVLILVLLYHL